MIVHDSVISELIVKVAEHYNTNISTRFLRPLMSGIFSDNELAHRIAELTENTDGYLSQGTHIDELYAQILAMARFVFLVRTDILPNLRNLTGSGGPNDANKVFREMAMNNFRANIQVLADYVHELYIRTVEYDKDKSGRHRPVYQDIAGLSEIGRYLVEK